MKKQVQTHQRVCGKRVGSMHELKRAWREHRASADIPPLEPPSHAPADIEFGAQVGPVVALKAPPRVVQPLPKPQPIPRQRLLDEQAVMREALSDGMNAEQWLQTDEDMAFVRPGVGPDVLRRLSRGEWSVAAELDLHGMRTEEARHHVVEFLRFAKTHHLRCVKIIHGKGLGSPGKTPVLKTKVKAWLQQKQEVIAYAQAPIRHGGAGALLLILKS